MLRKSFVRFPPLAGLKWLWPGLSSKVIIKTSCWIYKRLNWYPPFLSSKGLALRGHQVTVLSSFPREKPLKNYRDVTVKVDNLLEGKLRPPLIVIVPITQFPSLFQLK